MRKPLYFYQEKIVNKRSRSEGRFVTDRLAERLLADPDTFLGEVTRSERKSYRVESHRKDRDIPQSNREEEIVAIRLYKELDMFLDYQVPLPAWKGDPRGNIDLLMEWDGVLYLTELKRESSQETLLRAALEIETYYRMVDRELLLREWPPRRREVGKAVLLFENVACRAYWEWLHPEEFPHVHRLLKEWGIQVFTIKSHIDPPRQAEPWT